MSYSHRLIPASALAVALAFSAPAAAQSAYPFLPRGSSVLSGDDASVTIDLPFGMRWPNLSTSSYDTRSGPVVTSITITTNGIVYGGNGGTTGTTSGTEDLNAFLNGPPAAAILWDDLVASDVCYGEPYPGVVTITWTATEAGTTGPAFEMQMQFLRFDSYLDEGLGRGGGNRIAFVYGPNVPASDGLVGVTPGGGSSPFPIDFQTVGTGTFHSGTVHETFDAAAPFDLQDEHVVITFSQIASATTGNDTFGVATRGRDACAQAVDGLTLTPNLVGGYDVTAGAPFDSSFLDGQWIPVPSSLSPVSAAVTLPFAVPMPGGGSTTTLYIDAQGRVSDDPAFQSAASGQETVSELLNGPRTICPWWSRDLLSTGPAIWLHQDSPNTVTVTWKSESFIESITVQLRLFANGTYQFVYDFAAPSQVRVRPAIVGVSTGNGAGNPGASDLSAAPSSTGPTLYELFPPFSFSTVPDFNVRANDSIAMTVSDPVLGGPITASAGITQPPFPSGFVYFLGIRSGTPGFAGPIPLGIVSSALASCEFFVDLATPGAVISNVTGSFGFPATLATIPVVPQLIGFHDLSVQAFGVFPGSSPLLVPTSEWRLTLGV
jgi:hypothetical protein